MSQDAASTMQHVATGATVGGGSLSLLVTYSNEITIGAIVIGAIATVVFGVWDKIIQTQRNRINKQMIKNDILDSPLANLSELELNKLRKKLQIK